ncbi:DinB family protein [Maribacter antarcticus]|uniref:DinB family protein n=1 Tax=Maribacter antarcticus TaxID=505250 RepID=UPI00047B54F1|nr:DinB family protein [Maribacter antarcticus]
MKNELEITLQNRKNLLAILEKTTKEDLLKIPEGFRNNIWWNIAHVVVTQQILVYKLSGVPMLVPTELVEKFMKGTVPDGKAAAAEIKQISEVLVSTIKKTQEDYNSGLFKDFKPYSTSAKVTLSNVQDAISFNNFHEGIHLGSIFALRKML